jgi:hypothetical protein
VRQPGAELAAQVAPWDPQRRHLAEALQDDHGGDLERQQRRQRQRVAYRCRPPAYRRSIGRHDRLVRLVR